MWSEREGAEDFHAAHLAGVPGFSGAAAEDGARQGYLLPSQGDDRASLRRRKGETRNALYAAPRSDPSDKLGEAQVCCHESEKVSSMELEISIFSQAFMAIVWFI